MYNGCTFACEGMSRAFAIHLMENMTDSEWLDINRERVALQNETGQSVFIVCPDHVSSEHIILKKTTTYALVRFKELKIMW